MGLLSRKVDESWMGRIGAVENWHGTGQTVVDFDDETREVLALSDAFPSFGNSYVWQWAVRTCVDFLARNIAQLNLKTYERTEAGPVEVARDHELAKLIRRPNPRTNRFDMIRGTVADLALYDDAFWLKRFGKTRGSDKFLYRLPPAYVQARGNNLITGPELYVVNTRAGQREFGPEEIVHFHGYDPTDPHRGQPPLKALRGLLNEEHEASRYMARFLKKGMRFGGFLSRPAGKWGDDTARERFIKGLQRFARGGDREGEFMLLEDGITPQASQFSPKDSEFMALREFVLDITATAFNIPLAMLSRTDSQAFASMKEFHKILYTDVLGSWNAMIEGAVGLQLVPDFDDDDTLYVEFNIEEKMQGDWEAQANAARQTVQVPWESVNGMRKKRNEKPIGDPNDPNNPYNVPARSKNYSYGEVDSAETQQQPGLALAAGNGHADIDALDQELDALGTILEER